MPLDLLELLNAVVERDLRASGIFGKIGIGIRSATGERWWQADFGRELTTRFSDARPESCDVSFLVGEREAHALLFDDPLPDPPRILQLAGDAAMFDRFLDRYFSQSSLLDVRAQHASKPKKRKGHR